MTDMVIASLIDDMFNGDAPATDGNGQAVTNAETLVPPPAEAAEEPTGGLFGTWGVLILWAAVFGGMWFFLIRPQRNREKKMKEMQETISSGDNVITSGGLFGKIADVGDDCFIVEFGTNRSIRIPVLKSDVVGVRSPKMTPQPKEIEKDDEEK
ncbi:MAG: preprotein translocase subunit YajC [Defluviitaleaceae bacterium]|nr:preprotein translocase subunit YajC [Defluviitaleaceae bacterium]